MTLPKKITLRIVLQHMQAMEQRLTGQFESVDRRLGKVETRLETVETRLTQVERNLSRQIDAIDKRLDELEIAKLPGRVAKLERHTGLAAA